MSASAEAAFLPKVRIATTSLAGCFGCHMSLLDIDERILDLMKIAEFDRSPFTDIKHCGPCDIALIEGGVCNTENVDVLRELRDQRRAQRCATVSTSATFWLRSIATWTAFSPTFRVTRSCRSCSTKSIRSTRLSASTISSPAPPVRRRDLEISQRSDSGTHAASRSQSHALRLRPLARSIWKPPNRHISCAVWPSSRSRASRDTAR